jgi:hypothetical protein
MDGKCVGPLSIDQLRINGKYFFVTLNPRGRLRPSPVFTVISKSPQLSYDDTEWRILVGWENNGRPLVKDRLSLEHAGLDTSKWPNQFTRTFELSEPLQSTLLDMIVRNDKFEYGLFIGLAPWKLLSETLKQTKGSAESTP